MVSDLSFSDGPDAAPPTARQATVSVTVYPTSAARGATATVYSSAPRSCSTTRRFTDRDNSVTPFACANDGDGDGDGANDTPCVMEKSNANADVTVRAARQTRCRRVSRSGR